MDWKESNDIEQIVQTKLYETKIKKFTPWSLSTQCRILEDLRDVCEDYPVRLLGSGGYLFYRNRYFLVTNEHVIRDVEPSKIRAVCEKNGNKSPLFTNGEADKSIDIAVFEIDTVSLKWFKGYFFLNMSRIARNPLDILSKFNSVFFNAYPWEYSNIDFEQSRIDLLNLLYCGFVIETDQSGLIGIAVDKIAYDEHRKMAGRVPMFNGMSGSWAYGYCPDIRNSFKCIGILTAGTPEAGKAWVLSIDAILDYIDRTFFI